MKTKFFGKDTFKFTKKRWFLSIALCAWLLLIFGTSCTVIRPLEFFEIIQTTLGADRATMERFALFWGISWFAIVKGWHFTEFAILTFLTVVAVRWYRGFTDSSAIFGAMLFCFAFAVSDEFHQTFVPDRFGTVQDVLIDSLGVCAAGSMMLLRQKRKRVREVMVGEELARPYSESPSRILDK